MDMKNTRVIDETMIYLSGAKKLAGNPSVGRIRDWCFKGVQGPDGEIVTLDWAKWGGSTVTSVEAVERFHRAVNGDEE